MHIICVILLSLIATYGHANEKIGLYAGSFDPPTNAHLDIIERGSSFCDKLIVCVAVNPLKPHHLLPLAVRLELLTELTKSFENVTVLTHDGLTFRFAKEHQVNFFIRGVRSMNDFEAEYGLSVANRELSDIDTVVLFSKPEYRHVSSSLVREILQFKGPVAHLVPPQVLPYLTRDCAL